MAIKIISKEEQGKGAFNGGQIIENKPVGFPQDGGPVKPFSNIFYWAHAKAVADSTIGLHPHKGFEIMSVILEGQINHFDTKANEWLPLKAGDVQIIRSGSGISHSEHMEEKAEMFQIWFDPGLEKTMQKDPSYSDYRAADFPVTEENGIRITRYIGDNAPIEMDSPKVHMQKIEVTEGDYEYLVDERVYLSVYVLEGAPELQGNSLQESDFVLVEGAEAVTFKKPPFTLFAIESPVFLDYKTYREIMQQRFA